MYEPEMILSKNSKCTRSLNLPIKDHCRPTKVCAAACYAKSGHCALPCSTKKQAWVSQYLAGNQGTGSLARLIDESSRVQAVRLSGTGDLKKEHLPNLFKVVKACPNAQFWGMTRKLEIAKAVNGAALRNLSLMVSVDAASPKSVWKYQGALCFGPRRHGDIVPDDDRIKVVFPYHKAGRVVGPQSVGPKDCKAVWHDITGCHMCGKCWSWNK